jgi:hypothetical protein
MNAWRRHLLMVLLCVLAFLVGEEGMTLAGQNKSLNQASSAPTLTPRKESRAAQKASSPKATEVIRPSMGEPKTKNLRKPGVRPVELSSKKSPRALQARKKTTSKAVLQPRTDLIQYGVLRDSQRYDPRPYSRHGGLPHPQTSDLTFDHFQELDRNQDGMIDPVERAFGRIDMDRDLLSRTLH